MVADASKLPHILFRHQVGARGEHLPELHEHRPQCLQHPRRPGRQLALRFPALGRRSNARERRHHPPQPQPGHQVSQAVCDARSRDVRQAARAPRRPENGCNPHRPSPGGRTGTKQPNWQALRIIGVPPRAVNNPGHPRQARGRPTAAPRPLSANAAQRELPVPFRNARAQRPARHSLLKLPQPVATDHLHVAPLVIGAVVPASHGLAAGLDVRLMPQVI